MSSSEEKRENNSRNQRKQYLFVIKELVTREIKRKYARSYLGIVWSVLNPLLSMAVISVIFSHMFQKSIENYPVYYLTGSVIWQMFTGATNAAMTALVDNKSLLIKVRQPMEIFILSRVCTALVNLGYSMIPYGAILLVFKIHITPKVLLYPAVIFLVLMFSTGIAYMLSVAYVFFGDIKHLYSVFLTLLMYCSALFYPVDMLSDAVKKVVLANPVFNYINCARRVVLWGEIPTGREILQMILWAVGVLILGTIVFEKNKNKVMQRI